MYCTVDDVKLILPENVTIGDTNIGTPSPGRPVTKRDKLTEAEVNQFIRLAQQEVDSRLRPMYVCPLRRCKIHETGILNYAPSGTNVSIVVNDTGPFAVGQLVRLQSETAFEEAIITSIPNLDQLILNRTNSTYNSESIISVLEYPDPIPLITARLTVSYAFDRLFSAEQAPDVSQYGVNQRKLAMHSMDSILTGTAILMGQEHMSKRFARMSLFDSYKTPTDDVQFGREAQ